MSDESSYPGVYVDELPTGVRPIGGVSTCCAFVGRIARGSLDDSRAIGSFQDFVERYGGLDAHRPLGHSVLYFFANGGRSARIVPLSGEGGDPLGPQEIDATLERLDLVDDFQLLAVPGQAAPGVVARFQTYCLQRRAFYLVDCDEQATFATLENGPDPAITGPSAINSALYFPWVIAPDPLQESRLRPYPPSGFVAGIYARTDARGGVWKAPAGTEAIVTCAKAVSQTLADVENGVLNERGVNCIRMFPPRGALVWGSRTLRASEGRDSQWRYVPVRRLALFLENSLVRDTRWVVFEPNTESTWARAKLEASAFLHELFRQGAFQGRSPEEAYFVRCGRETMTPSDVDLGIVNLVVGFAPMRPAEFVIIKIQQMLDRGDSPSPARACS